MSKGITDEPKNKNDPGERNFELERQKREAVDQCFDWFEKDRQAKAPYVAEMDEMYKLYKSEHWSLLDDSGRPLRTDAQKQNHPNAVENIAFSLIEGLVAEFSEAKELVDYPTEEGDDEMARTMTELKEFIAYKNRNDMEFIKWLRNFFLYGTGSWEKYWDPNWKGGKGPNRWTGEIRWRAVHPRAIFPDARCLESAEDGRRIHKALYRTIEDVEETWPEEAKDIPPDSMNDEFLIPDDLENTAAESTEDQVLVVDTWYKGSPLILDEGEEDQGPGMHLIQWAGEGSLRYLAHQNYVYFEPDEDTTWPIDLKKCYERERSPWGIGEAYYLKNPQIMLNKTAETIIEGHLHEALGQTWYEGSAVTEKQKKVLQDKGTLAGMWFEVTDVKGIHREYAKGVPASLQNESDRLKKLMETIVGRFDISQGKTPGNITAFRALDLLASRAQVRLKSKEMTINAGYEDAGNYINRLITLHYDGRRKYRILGKDDSKPKYGVYDPDQMKKAYFYDTDESMPASDLETLLAGQEELPQEEQLIEGEDYEIYSPEFDTKCKITSKLPTDRVFYMEMAKELYTGGMIDDEIFWYVIDYGKFPPIEKIMEKVRQKQAAAMSGQPGQATEQMDPALAQQVQEFIEYLKANEPGVLQKIGKLPEEQQLPMIMKIMQESQQGGAAPADNEPAVAPDGPGVPPEADGQRIKQELVDILQAQKG